MRRRGSLLAVVALLLLTGCGGGDDEPASGASGESGAEAPASDITAGEFLQKLGPEKEIAIEGIVATTDACSNTTVDSSLLLLVSDAASKADPEEPLTPIVEAQC